LAVLPVFFFSTSASAHPITLDNSIADWFPVSIDWETQNSGDIYRNSKGEGEFVWFENWGPDDSIMPDSEASVWSANSGNFTVFSNYIHKG
jgi:hypothetical protein